MIKYHKYIKNKGKLALLKNKFRVFKRSKILFFKKIRYFFLKNSKIQFKKKFILNCIFFRKCTFNITTVCSISGKCNASISKLSFKRHTFKELLNLNKMPNFYKKSK